MASSAASVQGRLRDSISCSMVLGLAPLSASGVAAPGVAVMEGVALGAGVESQRDRFLVVSVEDPEETTGVASHLEELTTGVASHFWEVTRGVASEDDTDPEASMGVSSHRLRLNSYEENEMD